MRKSYGIIIITIMISLLCSCENAGLSSATLTPSAELTENSPSQSEASSTDISGETAHPSPEQSQPPADVDNAEREDIFSTFLSENYQRLSDACFGGIAGVGFIDLDMDGGIEMLVFDAGASAAMGLQFFDIIDEKVECVSANMDAVGEAFGGEHMSGTIVNANYFDDFRLMEYKTTGEKFYIVQSGNGAADFSYSELVRFGNDDGILTLTSLMYKYEDYDIDSGDVTGESFKINGKYVGRTEYETAYSIFFAGANDTGHDAEGVFMWDDPDYEASYDGLMAMAKKALTLYDELKNS